MPTQEQKQKNASHTQKKIPPWKGDLSHTPSVNYPCRQSKISAQARGRLLLDFLQPNRLLILNERLQKQSDHIP